MLAVRPFLQTPPINFTVRVSIQSSKVRVRSPQTPQQPLSISFRRLNCNMSLHSAACCSVPPVVSKGYSEKGKYITVDGLKTYATGPSDAKKAILVVYDIFGFFPQTIQGADILAYGDKENQYQVFMPDFFEGSPADISWYPPDNGKFCTRVTAMKTGMRVLTVTL